MGCILLEKKKKKGKMQFSDSSHLYYSFSNTCRPVFQAQKHALLHAISNFDFLLII